MKDYMSDNKQLIIKKLIKNIKDLDAILKVEEDNDENNSSQDIRSMNLSYLNKELRENNLYFMLQAVDDNFKINKLREFILNKYYSPRKTIESNYELYKHPVFGERYPVFDVLEERSELFGHNVLTDPEMIHFSLEPVIFNNFRMGYVDYNKEYEIMVYKKTIMR